MSAGDARAEGRFMGSVSMDRQSRRVRGDGPGRAAGAVDGGCGCVTFGGDEVFRVGGELPSLRVVSQRAVPDQAPQRTPVTTGVTGPLQEKAPPRGFPPLRCGVTARSRLTSVTVPEEG